MVKFSALLFLVAKSTAPYAPTALENFVKQADKLKFIVEEGKVYPVILTSDAFLLFATLATNFLLSNFNLLTNSINPLITLRTAFFIVSYADLIAPPILVPNPLVFNPSETISSPLIADSVTAEISELSFEYIASKIACIARAHSSIASSTPPFSTSTDLLKLTDSPAFSSIVSKPKIDMLSLLLLTYLIIPVYFTKVNLAFLNRCFIK